MLYNFKVGGLRICYITLNKMGQKGGMFVLCIAVLNDIPSLAPDICPVVCEPSNKYSPLNYKNWNCLIVKVIFFKEQKNIVKLQWTNLLLHRTVAYYRSQKKQQSKQNKN